MVPPADEKFEAGQILKERFALSERLADLPTREWWLAFDLKNGIAVGVALLRGNPNDASLARAFLNEAKTIAKMAGSPLVDFGQAKGGTLFLVVMANQVGTEAGLPAISPEQRKRCTAALN